MNYLEHVENIRVKKRYSFSRWGDGEWLCIFGANGANCDKHQYFPELRIALRKVLESKPTYYIALQKHAMKTMAEPINDTTNKFGLEWVASDIFHNANINGELPMLLDVLNNRNVVLIGGNHLKDYNKDWTFIEVPRIDCWLSYENTKNKISEYFDSLEGGESPVLLFCASMMSNVLINDFHNLASNTNIDATLIDFGSVLDPYVGVNSRSYHSKLKI